jgi:hypothetical protein
MNARTAIAAALLASLPLLAPLRAAAHDGDPRPVAVLGLNAGAGYGPVVSLGVQIPGAGVVAYAPQPPPVAYAPPPTARWAPAPAPWTPPAAWGPRAVRAACISRFGPDPWRVSRCEARWLALRPVPGPRWAAAGWPRHGHGHHDD